MEIVEERHGGRSAGCHGAGRGIGSATAIYTVIDAVLMKPVPWQHGER